jgi:hypothetical protein
MFVWMWELRPRSDAALAQTPRLLISPIAPGRRSYTSK